MINECEAEELYPEHFLVPAHKYIYMSIIYLYSKNTTPTPLAIYEVLVDKTAKKEIEDMGGLEYLTTLSQSEVHEDNLSIYCQKIKQTYTRKKIFDICDEVQAQMLSDKSETLNPLELISIPEGKINNLSVEVTTSSEVYKMGDETDEILEQRMEEPDVVPGLETKWVQLDRYTNGGQPGDLIMLCARSKVGKSVTLTNWATQFAIKDKLPILYIDTEMNHREQEDRILSNLSYVPHNEIVSGLYCVDTEFGKAEEKMKKVSMAKEMLRSGHYYHIYMPTFTLDSISAIARQFKNRYDISALFFDYLKFPANQVGTLKSAQEWQMLGFIASGLKDLAGTLNIPIYSACQENRIDVKGTKKDASNIGGSDRILQLATKLIFLYNKPEDQIAKEGIQNGNQQIYVAYQRNGMSDCPPINIMFDKPYLRQKEI